MERLSLLYDGPAGTSDDPVPLTQGVPFGAGQLPATAAVRLRDEAGATYPAQTAVLATWEADLAWTKWLLVDAQLPRRPAALFLEYGDGVAALAPHSSVAVADTTQAVTVDTGVLRLTLLRGQADFLGQVEVRTPAGWRHALAAGDAAELYVGDSSGLGSSSLAPAPAPRILVEDAGPVRACVCVRGIHADANGRRVFPYTLRLHLYAGSGQIRCFHTFVFDQDPDVVKLAAVGWRLPLALGEVAAAGFGGQGRAHLLDRPAGEPSPGGAGGRADWQRARWLQLDDRHYEVRTAAAGQPELVRDSGVRTRAWGQLAGAAGSVAVALRDAWQEFPKGLEFDQEGIVDIQLWPAGDGRLLDLEVPWKVPFVRGRTREEVLAQLASHPGAGVNFKGFLGTADLPPDSAEGDLRSIREARRLAAAHLGGRRVVFGDVACDPQASAFGMAKTHEFWLRFDPAPLAPAAAEAWAASCQMPAIAPAHPEHACATGVVRLTHPTAPARWPEAEAGLEAVFDALLERPVARDRLYGMIDYGDLLNAHGRAHGYTYRVFARAPGVKITDLIGWYNNECFDNCYTQWVTYVRTGQRKYWRLAEAYSEHLEDVDTIHAAGPRPEELGLSHYHNILHWSARASHSHSPVNGWLLHYYLTGNRRALEVARQTADNAVNTQEPAGVVSNRGGVLRREFCVPMANLWLLYLATWEERYGDCARRSLDLFLAAQPPDGIWPRDIFTGGPRGDRVSVSTGVLEMGGASLEPHVLYDAYRLTGDPRIRRCVLAAAEALLAQYRAHVPGPYAHVLGHAYMIYPRPPALWLAFAHELTGDQRFLAPLAELLEAFPAMARAWARFDKWIPIQAAGYMPRYVATAMAALRAAPSTPRKDKMR